MEGAARTVGERKKAKWPAWPSAPRPSGTSRPYQTRKACRRASSLTRRPNCFWRPKSRRWIRTRRGFACSTARQLQPMTATGTLTPPKRFIAILSVCHAGQWPLVSAKPPGWLANHVAQPTAVGVVQPDGDIRWPGDEQQTGLSYHPDQGIIIEPRTLAAHASRGVR